MPKSITITSNYSGDLGNGQGSITLTDTVVVESSPTSILAAQPGVLTTHSTNTTGSLTMTSASHGIITGQRIDIYWAGGACYNAVAGTVAGTVVPIASVSGGSNLPASLTPVTIGIPVQTAFAVAGANLTALTCTSPVQAYFIFDVSTADDVAILLPAPTGNGSSYVYGAGMNYANLFASYTLTSVWISHANTAGPLTTLQAGALSH